MLGLMPRATRSGTWRVVLPLGAGELSRQPPELAVWHDVVGAAEVHVHLVAGRGEPGLELLAGGAADLEVRLGNLARLGDVLPSRPSNGPLILTLTGPLSCAAPSSRAVASRVELARELLLAAKGLIEDLVDVLAAAPVAARGERCHQQQ